MRLRINRTDGKTGNYSQPGGGRAAVLLRKLNPQTLFCSGPIIIGVLNPFTVLNADEVCWVEVVTELETIRDLPPDIERVRKLSGREEYEQLLARQWPRWLKHRQGKPGDLLEAFVELSFRGGEALYLHITGTARNIDLADSIFGRPAITATFEPDGTVYINPKCLVRARIYHSRNRVAYPTGIWVAEADDV